MNATPPDQQIAALQRQVDQLQAENRELRAAHAMLRSILDAAPSVIYLKDDAGTYLFANRRYTDLFQMSPEQIVGQTDHDFLPPAVAEGFVANDREVLERRESIEREEFAETPLGRRTYFSIKFPLETTSGTGVAGISTDITERKALEERQVQLQADLIRLQETALAELSTPIIPVTERILVMPLVGAVDSRRATDMLERMLGEVAQRRATTLIIDITGVPIVDTQVAGIFIKAAQAVKLLGVEVVLTGIRPEVAQTLVSLGFNLAIPTYSDLQSAVTTLLRRA
ncbi:MAG TPA: PAS domain-containing protein [Herpetosiphonaceae bacterium]